jgi:hypothetical protein
MWARYMYDVCSGYKFFVVWACMSVSGRPAGKASQKSLRSDRDWMSKMNDAWWVELVTEGPPANEENEKLTGKEDA